MNDEVILRRLIDSEANHASPNRTVDCAHTILLYCKVFEVDTAHRRHCAEKQVPPAEGMSLDEAAKQLKRHEELEPHISRIKERITAVIREMDSVDYLKSND